MNRKHMFIILGVLLVLAIFLPMLNIKLPFGNPNLGTTPVTLAAVFLPWYMAVITGLVKGVSAAAFTGRWLVEISAGAGDALMACFTFWMARHFHKSIAAILGQFSRLIFTSGLVALSISVALATGLINPAQAPVSSLTGNFFESLAVSWVNISYPSITISILYNLIVSVLVILACGRYVDRFLTAKNMAASK